MPSNLPRPRRACPWEVRDRFNALGIVDALRKGRIRVVQIYDGEPNPDYGQPPGTRSQAIEFFDVRSNRLIARVHRYRQPGYQSTLYDPKWLFDWQRGEVLTPVRDKDHRCSYCQTRSTRDWAPDF